MDGPRPELDCLWRLTMLTLIIALAVFMGIVIGRPVGKAIEQLVY
jgi:hypothetical protein